RTALRRRRCITARACRLLRSERIPGSPDLPRPLPMTRLSSVGARGLVSRLLAMSCRPGRPPEPVSIRVHGFSIRLGLGLWTAHVAEVAEVASQARYLEAIGK